MGDTSGGKEVSFEAPYKLFGIGKSLTSKDKKIIFNVYCYLANREKEENAERPKKEKRKITKTALYEETEKALGTSVRSVRRVVNEFDKDNQIVSPKKRNTPNPFPKVDGVDLDAIRRIVHYFYKANESPTLKKIHAAVKSQLNFPYGHENLRQILIKIGFRYRKRGRERIFYERGDIVSWREKYLRRIKQIREQEPERDIVYLDETWLTEGRQKNKEWVDTSTLKDPQKTKSLSLTTGCTNLHVGKGRRIVISDAITENGTVPGVLWIYKAASKKSTGKYQTENKKKGGSSSSSKVSVENKDNDDNQGDSGLGIEQDYHDEMDHEKYENYFETQICKNVYKISAVVIDNASYHSKYSEDHPKSTWKKAQYAERLKKRTIPNAKDALRPTLWKLAKEKRENYPENRLEKIAYKYGHEIVRLPPYHCQLNPIELI